MKEKVTFQSGEHELTGVFGIPDEIPAPGVLLFHGLSNTKEDCPMIEETSSMLVQGGYVTFRFDFFGSGESPGSMKDKTLSVMKKNAEDAIDYFYRDERVSGNLGLWGRSIGGTMVALTGIDSRVSVRVFLTPSIRLQEGFGRFDEIKEMEEEAEEKGGKLPGTGDYKGKFGLNEEFFNELPKIEGQIKERLEKMSKVLVFATTPDVKVPLSNATEVINRTNDPKEIHIFEDVDHDYAGAEEEVLDIERRWYKRFLPTSPT